MWGEKAKEIIDSGKIGKILSSSIVSAPSTYLLRRYTMPLQIALAPRELFVWGPQIKDSSSYTADSTRGKVPNYLSKLQSAEINYCFNLAQAQPCSTSP